MGRWLEWSKPQVPVSLPLDGATGAFYVKGPVTCYGGIASSLKGPKEQELRADSLLNRVSEVTT